MTHRLFVYGTLAPGQPNAHLLTPLKGLWQRASVRGALHPEGWGATLGYPAIILDESAEPVEGYVFTSAALAAHWPELDEFEGDAYARVATSVTLDDNTTVEAFVYVLRR